VHAEGTKHTKKLTNDWVDAAHRRRKRGASSRPIARDRHDDVTCAANNGLLDRSQARAGILTIQCRRRFVPKPVELPALSFCFLRDLRVFAVVIGHLLWKI